MFGTNHQALLDWLAGVWRPKGPPVCVVEGFSGVGKTEVALELQHRVPDSVLAEAPASGNLDDLLFEVGERLAEQNHLELSNAIDDGKPLEAALLAVLRLPVLIIVDEFQRMLDAERAEPKEPTARLLERVSKTRDLRGRLVLLTHRAVEKTRRWGERVQFKSLGGLSANEGAELLGRLLRERDREAEIPPHRRPDVSRWLGGNPRAIRVLVGCLEHDPLDTLTGVLPEAWEARDQQVSERLLADLERELLRRAVERLDREVMDGLERLSVFRKPVKRDGLERQTPPGMTVDRLLSELASRFLLEHRAGWYELNPVVREIALHKLKESAPAMRAAQRTAAGHYTRHFTGKQIVNVGQLGGAFVEARYHLVQAEEEAQLATIAARFGDHLRAIYTSTTRPPVDPQERDEQIGVLSAYLASAGPKGMEYYLARLLAARGRPADGGRALEQAWEPLFTAAS